MAGTQYLALRLSAEDGHQHPVGLSVDIDRTSSLGQPHLDPELIEHGPHPVELIAVEGAFVLADDHGVEPAFRGV